MSSNNFEVLQLKYETSAAKSKLPQQAVVRNTEAKVVRQLQQQIARDVEHAR
jgi:hypothetical protein